jgi:adenylate kinase family enzyme
MKVKARATSGPFQSSPAERRAFSFLKESSIMASDAQQTANQANAQKSTGPKTEDGKAKSSLNNLKFGLSGRFHLLKWEKQDEYDNLLAALCHEHHPQTPFELELVEKMAQHYWVAKRAMHLQDLVFHAASATFEEVDKQLKLYLRYQTTHERAFEKCVAELRRLRGDVVKAHIGFESHKRQKAQDERNEALEKRRQEKHESDQKLAAARLDAQILRNIDASGTQNPLPIDLMRHVATPKAA